MTAMNWPSGNVTSMSLRLCSRAPWTVTSRPLVARAPDLRHRDGLASGQVATGERVRALQQVVDRSGDDDLTAVLARTRADVDDPVAGADGVLVVLDDDHGVAEVAQTYERLDEPVVVALVQTDGRLVEHVEHADQAGADLGGEPDALRLAAGECPGGAVEGEVVEPDVEQEAEPLVDLLEHPLADLALAVGHLQRRQVLGGLPDRQRRDLGDVLGPVLAAVDEHRPDDGVRRVPSHTGQGTSRM